MQTISFEDQNLLQAELSLGETLLWTAKPNPRVIFHPSDLGIIPFSILWAGFSVLWEAGVSGYGPWANKSQWNFGLVWGIPFVLIGQYMVWGRFIYVAWKKKKIVYALTTERLLLLVRPPQPKVISMYLRSVTGVEKEIRNDGIGTLKFRETPPIWGRGRGSQTASELYLECANPRIRRH